MSLPGFLIFQIAAWITCDLKSFSTVFQSYQVDGKVIMKAVNNGAQFTVGKISAFSRSRTRGSAI